MNIGERQTLVIFEPVFEEGDEPEVEQLPAEAGDETQPDEQELVPAA